MEAMIFAAGLGTRLRPLTHDIPKALVEIGGKPALEHVARRLIEAGADRLIINVHHHADQILDFLERVDYFGVDVRISMEPDRPLETGGGLRAAEKHFSKESSFFVHNSDILTNVNLHELYRAHERSDAVATLAVVAAESSRCLLFDAEDELCGYGDREGNEHLIREPTAEVTRLDFIGVHAASPRLFDLMTETGVFSIIDTYLRLSREGERVRPHRVDGITWIDVGKPERLRAAKEMFEVPRND